MFDRALFFNKHLRPIFIETGAYFGGGIEDACHAGFQRVYSIELSRTHYQHCLNRFLLNSNIRLFYGPSNDHLRMILPAIFEPVTFFLDAHCSGGETAGTGQDYTVLQELAVIRQYNKRHECAIILDDANTFGNKECWMDNVHMADVLESLKACCPKSVIYYDMAEDGIGLRSLISSPVIATTNPQIIYQP